MRIITGSLKGRKISVPPKVLIRPTSDRTKESIFSKIDVRKAIKSCRILDLFAGTGNLGFEALSRGAEHVIFVESSHIALDHIEKTALQFGLNDHITGYCISVEQFLQGPSQAFDLIFADPPYEYEKMTLLPDIILENEWLKEDGWFILEHDKRYSFSDHTHCTFSKSYGRTIVTIFNR